MASRGQPKIFKNGAEIIELFTEYCKEIADDGYQTAPTKTDFCRWLKEAKGTDCNQRTVYNSLNKYFPDIKKEFDEIRADTIMQGGMTGHYQPTMSIFGLKNWCGFVDKTEQQTDATLHVSMEDSLKEFAE